MRIKSRLVVAVLAVLCVATMANAGIYMDVAPGVDVGGGLLSYTVSLRGTDGDFPVAFDGTFTGPLNQVKVMTFDTPSLSFAMLLPNIAQDTHFLFMDSAVTIPAGKAPAETATTLSAAFSYTAPFAESRILAQIVLPAGDYASFSGQFANAVGTKFTVPMLVPEPASLSLLGVGMLGLIRRRR